MVRSVFGNAMRPYIKSFIIALAVYLLLVAGFAQLYFPKVTSKLYHEIIATILFVVVIVHIVLMRSYFTSMLKQKGAFFYYRNFVIIGLAVSFIITVICGIALSKHLYPGLLPIERSFARQTHTTAAVYTYIFAGLHLGCYLTRFLNMLNEYLPHVRKGAMALFTPARLTMAGFTLIAINGLTQVFTPGYWAVLSAAYRKLSWDRERSVILNTMDQLSITVLFMLISALLVHWLLTRNQRD